jgi:ATP-dependent DNA helicase UvrD/PcrA
MFEPSPQQLAVFDFVQNDTHSCVVEARAGSGKTTTLVELAKITPTNKLSLFLAFNKNIATELQQRLPQHVQSKTFHSHCFGALQRNLSKRPRVDENKVFNILKDTLNRRDFDIYFKYVSRLVSYAKSYGIGTELASTDESEWYRLIDHFNMVADSGNFDESMAIGVAQSTLVQSNENLDVIDFDDMLYLALLRNVTFDKCNYVMLDEAQDTNGVQRALLHRMLAKGLHHEEICRVEPEDCDCVVTKDNMVNVGRLIAVGDPAQSIYGFRGADSDAMEALTREFNCVTFPLSVSYRCAQEVVLEAKKVVPEIESHPTAPIGTVETLPEYDLDNFDSTHAVLCRVTAPLVTLALGFIRRNVGVRILGREIGAGLVALVKKMNTQDIDTFVDKLERWRAREVTKASSRNHDSAVAAIDDKANCLKVFVSQLNEDERTVNQLIQRIESLFSDNNKGLLTLCSVHKAKGLEWPTVFILDKDVYMPSRWAKQEWQHKQETNLIYVAVTRAKEHLRYIKSDRWKKPKVEPRDNELENKRKELLETL